MEDSPSTIGTAAVGSPNRSCQDSDSLTLLNALAMSSGLNTAPTDAAKLQAALHSDPPVSAPSP